MLKKILVVFFVFFQFKALADARPITYNITMDYNSVTGQFENAKVTGSETVRITANSKSSIEIQMEKDGVKGMTTAQAGGGDHQIGIRRTYTDFSFTLMNSSDNTLTIPVNAYLAESRINHHFISRFHDDHNSNCDSMHLDQYGVFILSSYGKGCYGRSKSGTPANQLAPINSSRMVFHFDVLNKISELLSKPNYKVGDYVGSVVYTGDSVESRVNGKMTESYTFNFIITKKKQLTTFDFPSGLVADFIVNRYGNQYVGVSEVFFNVNGVFNSFNGLRFTFTSANGHLGKFNLKHYAQNTFIPYNIKLENMKLGRPINFSSQGESKTLLSLSDNVLNGKLTFDFMANSDEVVAGDYSDRLTIMVALDI